MRPSSETGQSCLVETVVVDVRELPGSVFLGRILLFKALGVTLCLQEGRLERVIRRRRPVKAIE